MKKITLLFLLLFSLTLRIFTQQYFFYHIKDKMTMTRDYSYISVKFKENTPNAEINKLSNELTPYTETKVQFKTRLDDKRESAALILQIKKEVSVDYLNLIKSNIAINSNVKQVGMCFTAGDKVLHLTTDEVIVKFKENVSRNDIQNLNRLFKTEIIEQVSSFENTFLLSVNSSSVDNVFEVSNKYSLTQFVEYAQPNFIRLGMLLSIEDESVPPFITPPYVPNDTMFPMMWSLRNTGNNIPDGVQGTPGCDMNVVPAWDITRGHPHVLIAITDTGIDTNHTDLRPNLSDRTLWYDAYENDQQPWDEYSHGTGVSGTTAATGNNVAGTVGVAFDCKLMPVRVFGPPPVAPTTDLILAKGLNWSWTHGACVINCSWGGGIPTPLITNAIRNAVHYGRGGKGTVIFAGVGNSDTNIVIYPASMPEVIGVGGLSPCNERKSKTSCDRIGGPNQNWGACYGEGMEIVAPTTYIGTTTLGGGWCICGNGTSVASPLAAGVGGLILAKNINLSGDSVKMIIEKTARKVGNYSYNIQKENGLWNEEMGYGRIDARDALDMTPPGPVANYNQVPPLLNIIPPQSQVYNTSISVYADIYDNEGLAGGDNSPRMYYRTLQSNSIQVVKGVMTSANRYRFTFPLVPVSEGFYYYLAAQDITPDPNFVTYPLGGRGTNPPGNVAPPKFMFVRNTSTVDSIYISTDVPIIISNNMKSSNVSVLNVPVGKTVVDVNCTVDITHSYVADLVVSLVSPQGTEIILFGGVGGDGNDFANTTFDDEATVAIDSSAALAPFTGVFKPVERLWLLDGENSFGEWKLKIFDNGPGDGGALENWNLTIRYSSGPDYVTIPGNFSLVKNYPNPFNPKTRIVFNVPRTANIKIVIYDVSGREVKTVLNEQRAPMLEDFVDFDASTFASGVYFYSLIADDEFIESKKMVLVK
jgi:subtilisin-like proprotein convertase family protein